MDELWEAVSWAQLGYHAKPVGLLNAFGFYDGLVAFNRQMADTGFIRPMHRDIIIIGERHRGTARQDGRFHSSPNHRADARRGPVKRIKPRPLVSSHVVKATPRQMGGGRERSALVEQAKASIAKGSKSFAVASLLFDKATRERAHLLYAWCRRCDDIADGQDHGAA